MATCTDNMKRNIQAKNIYPVTEQSQSNRIALLINNMDFYDPGLTRFGSQKDEEAMLDLLQTLGYEVERYRNLSAQRIDEALKTFSRHRKLALTDSVFVVLMSHGGTRTIWGIDNQRLEISNIYERLNTKSCPALKGKPKIIIIQASRGVYQPGRVNWDMDNIRSPPVNQDARLHIEQDFITFHSNVPHVAAYRHPQYSSFFIQSIAEVFTIRCFEDPIDELIRKVREKFYLAGAKQQMPTVEKNTLTKHFYLLPGKKQLVAGQKDLHRKADCLRVQPAGVQWVRSELRKNSCQLTIDTNTLNRKLKLSNNNKKVTYVMQVQPYHGHPDRFDRPQLLCRNALTGRGYWEVEWTGEVYIAVSYRGIRRKGDGNETLFGWNNQSWSLYCSDKYTVWHDSKETALSSSSFSSLSDSGKVAVYVDCHAGTLSFFRVSSDTLIHLHTFQTKFTEPVYPGFRVFTGSTLCLC